jgi:hypothetical protein
VQSKKQPPAWETDSSSPSQQMSPLLWNSKSNCRAHKSPLLFPILSQINPVQTSIIFT